MAAEDSNSAVLLKQYEGKLATLSVFNDALQKENTLLREQIEEKSAPLSATEQDVLELKQEFTRRMAIADKDVARLKEKNEQLRNKLKALSQGGSGTQARLKDREEYITSLQSENEALTRKNNELESVTRKLRASTKELEGNCSHLESRVTSQEEQLAREREQHQQAITSSASQVAQVQAQYKDLQQRALEQINAALQEAAAAERAATERAEAGNRSSLQASYQREEEIEASLACMQAEHQAAEQAWNQREESLRREVVSLEARVRQLEADIAEAMAAASEGTRPFLRQIQSMAAAAKVQEQAREDAERNLLGQLYEAQSTLSAVQQSERTVTEKLGAAEASVAASQAAAAEARRRLAGAQEKLSVEEKRGRQAAARSWEAEACSQELAAAAGRERAQHAAEQSRLETEVAAARREVHRLTVELQTAGSRPPRAPPESLSPQESSAEPPALPVSTSSRILQDAQEPASRRSPGVATAPGRPPDPSFEGLEFQWGTPGNTRDHGLPPGAAANGHASSLQAGRVTALEVRLAAAEAAVEQSNAELLKACERAECAQADARRYHAALAEKQVLQARHEMALELLGERNERVESLEDDVHEMKHIFHTQLSTLVDELNSMRHRQQHSDAH